MVVLSVDDAQWGGLELATTHSRRSAFWPSGMSWASRLKLPADGRISGENPDMTDSSHISIVPLTPDRLPDLAALFEEGGDPKWCWCAYFRVRSIDFSSGGKARHRSVLEGAVVDNAAEGRAPGLLAYDGDKAVGWMSIGPRDDYERLAHSRVLARVDDTLVWSIVCFVVGRRSRGRGIARALLAAGIAYAWEHGATSLEAYPVEVSDGSRVPSANVYRGTLSMFEAAGFEVVARRHVPGTAAPRPIVRLELGAVGRRQSAIPHRPGLS